jgi:hypothetical protein
MSNLGTKAVRRSSSTTERGLSKRPIANSATVKTSKDDKIATVERLPAFEFDPIAESKLRLKIDLYIVPTVALIYLFCFIDRANIGMLL